MNYILIKIYYGLCDFYKNAFLGVQNENIGV